MNRLKQIIKTLSSDEQRKGIQVVGSVLLSALLDFVGLATLLPVIYSLLEKNENHILVLGFCLFALAFITVKNGIKIRLGKGQRRYLMSIYKRLSYSLFEAYYQKGILYIKEKGSSKLAFDVNQMCYTFSNNVVGAVLTMMGDASLVLLVLLALTVYSPITSLVLLVSFLPFALIYIWTLKKRVQLYGKKEQEARRSQARLVIDAYRGYAELEANGAYLTMRDAFLAGMEKICENRLKVDNYMRIPALLTELSVVVGLTMLTVVPFADTKMLIGIFAVAAFRLLPAVKNILSGYVLLQNNSYIVDAINEGLDEYQTQEVQPQEDILFQEAISVKDLAYHYPDGETVFDNLSFEIKKGEYVGFKGYSGVGKTTLFNLLLGFLTPTEGEICIDNQHLTQSNQKSWLRQVGYVPQDVYVFNGSVAENIALGCESVDKGLVTSILKQVGLWEWVTTLPNGCDTTLNEAGTQLSGGQRQRIGIARAIYQKVDVLFLDEATSSLDSHAEMGVMQMLASLRYEHKDLTILSISHRESTLSMCNKIISM